MLARLFAPRDGASLHALVRAAVGTGAVPPDLLEYLEATLSLPELTLRDVMVPRVDVVAAICRAAPPGKQLGRWQHTATHAHRCTVIARIGRSAFCTRWTFFASWQRGPRHRAVCQGQASWHVRRCLCPTPCRYSRRWGRFVVKPPTSRSSWTSAAGLPVS